MQSNSAAAREVRIEETEEPADAPVSPGTAAEPLAIAAAPAAGEPEPTDESAPEEEALAPPGAEDIAEDQALDDDASAGVEPEAVTSPEDIAGGASAGGTETAGGFAIGFLAANAGGAELALDEGSDDPEAIDDGEDERPSAVVTLHPRADRNQHLRIVEAALFAAAEPVDIAHLRTFLPEGAEVEKLLSDLQANYANRGVNLIEVAGKWLFRTAEDLGYILRREEVEQRKLSKAAMETLAIIAYHQPVTRAEIEDIRGVAISKGTLDMLLEIGWVRMRGRRKTPGRPVTYGTTEAFLSHFGLNEVSDLPGLQELKGAGLLEANLPPGFDIPMPRAGDELTPDEEPLDGTESEFQPPLEMHMSEQPGAETGAAEKNGGGGDA